MISAVQAEENPVVQSSTCNSVRDMYKNDCCSEECQLCKTSSGILLDLRGDVVVQQGGYDASCQSISDMLSKSYFAKEAICSDAQTELAGKCCYQQCTLCGDQSESISTLWFNTVTYQGLTTTCLGLDYMLRAEQLRDGSDRCSALQVQYINQCCHQSANSCQLCVAGEALYEIDSSKNVTIYQSQSSSTKPCSVVNLSLAKYQETDEKCMEERQIYFGECCISNDVVDAFDPTSIGGGETSSSPVAVSAVPNPATDSPFASVGVPTTSTNFWPPNESSGGAPSPSPNGGKRAPAAGGVAPDSYTSEGQASTHAPSQLYFWDSPAKFAWEEWDPPRNTASPVFGGLWFIIHIFFVIV